LIKDKHFILTEYDVVRSTQILANTFFKRRMVEYLTAIKKKELAHCIIT
jgi:hypothetical protein